MHSEKYVYMHKCDLFGKCQTHQRSHTKKKLSNDSFLCVYAQQNVFSGNLLATITSINLHIDTAHTCSLSILSPYDAAMIITLD